MKVSTGIIGTYRGEKGLLEYLSIGDYGKDKNIRAEFLGYTREIHGVPSAAGIKPLAEKWVITISTQYGCSQTCTFCDVPKVPFGGNATVNDMMGQIKAALACYPEVRYTDRLNIHFARMGEPLFNWKNVIAVCLEMQENKKELQDSTGVRVETLHPVLSTSLPRIKDVEKVLQEWCFVKNKVYHGQAGLQLSINSTSEEQRQEMFQGRSMRLEDISRLILPPPVGRKYCLNFAYCDEFEVDAEKLAKLFDPKMFMVKITPIHHTMACIENGLKTTGGYDSYAPYRRVEQNLISSGFDVLVFIPSWDEEHGMITCGNLILRG